ncbi:hypothetical protein [Nocardia sp. CY41]|uniref:hypothetical protein n=1 Tax=Nocardia sp. CY41 TaxID=2608686 RepID=UPI00135C4C32|nr:hypothetical protein [Nocardia sp. CY41]
MQEQCDACSNRADDRSHSADLFLDESNPHSGATWQGLLTVNEYVSPDPALTWSLYVPGWPDGNSSADVMIDWIPLEGTSWRGMEGAQVECTEAEAPISAYIYDGCHYAFDYVHIQVLRQVGTTARFAIELADCDEIISFELADGTVLETDRPLYATVDARFDGIRMQLDADRELAEFTDTSGLAYNAVSGLYEPVDTGTTACGSKMGL